MMRAGSLGLGLLIQPQMKLSSHHLKWVLRFQQINLHSASKKRMRPIYHHPSPCQLPTYPETQHRSWAHNIDLYCIGQNKIRGLDPTCWKAEGCCKGRKRHISFAGVNWLRLWGWGLEYGALCSMTYLNSSIISPALAYFTVFPHSFPR